MGFVVYRFLSVVGFLQVFLFHLPILIPSTIQQTLSFLAIFDATFFVHEVPRLSLHKNTFRTPFPELHNI
jgi:hypothetical protein